MDKLVRAGGGSGKTVSVKQPLKQMAGCETMGFLPLLQQLELKLILNSFVAFQISEVSLFT